MKLIIQCVIEEEYLPVFVKLGDILFKAPTSKLAVAETFIEMERYKDAEKVLDEIEKEYGESVFTVRLRTRISRIELLGV